MVGHFALIISIFISKLLCALCEYKNYYVKLLLESGSGYVLRCDNELKTRQRSVCGMQIKRYYLACKVSKIFKGADRASVVRKTAQVNFPSRAEPTLSQQE